MLNMRRELEFKYDVKELLVKHGVDEKQLTAFIATLFSKGSRIDLDSAREYVQNKCAEGLFDKSVEDEILYLLSKYRRWR